MTMSKQEGAEWWVFYYNRHLHSHTLTRDIPPKVEIRLKFRGGAETLIFPLADSPVLPGRGGDFRVIDRVGSGISKSHVEV